MAIRSRLTRTLQLFTLNQRINAPSGSNCTQWVTVAIDPAGHSAPSGSRITQRVTVHPAGYFAQWVMHPAGYLTQWVHSDYCTQWVTVAMVASCAARRGHGQYSTRATGPRVAGGVAGWPWCPGGRGPAVAMLRAGLRWRLVN